MGMAFLMRAHRMCADFPDQSTGIFGTGAGYDRVDTVEWVPVKDPMQWKVWEDEMVRARLALTHGIMLRVLRPAASCAR